MSEIKLQAGQWYRDRQGEILYCISNGAPRHKKSSMFVCEYRNRNCDFFRENGWYTDPNEQIKDIIEHLPDCTGFDWVPPKPIEPPEGWRLLTEGEAVCVGDMAWDDKGFWDDELLSSEQKIVGQSWNVKYHYPIARKIEPKLQLREGAWYERKDGKIVGPCVKHNDKDRPWAIDVYLYSDEGINSATTLSHIVREVDPPQPPQPKYRPFKDRAEFKPFRDKWVKYKQSDVGKTMLCVSFSNEGVTAGVSFMPYKTAFDSLVFEDGSPFGVLEDE